MPQAAPTPAPTPSSNTAQNNMQKWEADEPLGENATIAMILYANINHANLKVDYPKWEERIKQIANIWKNLPNEKRVPYVTKARENRTANRMNRGPAETNTTTLNQDPQMQPQLQQNPQSIQKTDGMPGQHFRPPLPVGPRPTNPQHHLQQPQHQQQQQTQQQQMENRTQMLLQQRQQQMPGTVQTPVTPQAQPQQNTAPGPGPGAPTGTGGSSDLLA